MLVFGIILVVGAIAVAILTVMDQFGKAGKQSKAAEIIKHNYDEARDFKRRKQLPSIRVSILLKEREQGIFEEPSILSEARGHQSFGGGAVEVEGVMLGGLTSRNVDQVEEIDSGALVLTNQRLVFTGKMENRTVQLKDVIAVRRHPQAIEISAAGKSQFYSVRNPILWSETINQLASGNAR